jgi:hypothetical protein
MNKTNFPWIAFVFGLALLGGLFASGAIPPVGNYKLPLLLQLFMSEFGAVLCAAGAYAGGSHWLANRKNSSAMLAALLCAVLAVALGASGIMIWQHSVAA